MKRRKTRSSLAVVTVLGLLVGMLAMVPVGATEGDQCGDPFTPIYDIQGATGYSPIEGDVVWTQGVITADFQRSSELSGFFVQDVAGDGDDATSDGVFVYHRNSWGFDVSVGDTVRFEAEVDERYGHTQLKNLDKNTASVCGFDKVNPAKMFLPVDDMDDWEAVEGMLVEMPQKLHVSGNYTQGRYGEVDLSFNWPLDNPTNVVSPGGDAQAFQAENDLSRIQLEDGSRWQNYGLPYFYDEAGYRTLRTGDTTKQKLTGVVTFDRGSYEIQPVTPVEFQKKNPRPDGPPNVKGDLTVASFNVLNFFTHLDDGSHDFCGPLRNAECRGADSAFEFDRQLAKIVAGIIGLDADVVGLQEIENDIFDDEYVPNRKHDAVLSLVEALNIAEGSGVWAWGGEANYYNDYPVRNEIIFKIDSVTPASAPVALLSDAFDKTRDRFPGDDEPVGRPPLAQTFVSGDGEVFTVVVNHFKSKGSGCSTLLYEGVADVDTGDGQANCNLTRVAQSQALMSFVSYLQLSSGDDDVLVIGDLNSYAMEDPISILTSNGYTNLIEEFEGLGWKKGAYSYNFFSQSGYLDQALATPSMADQVKGAAFWHINADEPSALDYNSYNQSELYNPDEFRSSDHDPVLVGLRLGK